MKKNKLKFKDVFRKVLALAIITCLGIAGIAAYFTDADTTTNTFTVGRISLELQEPNWPGDKVGDAQDITPNQEVDKDPQVTNNGINDAYVFTTVAIPYANVKTTAQDGTRNATNTVLYSILDSNGVEKQNDGWYPMGYLVEDGTVSQSPVYREDGTVVSLFAYGTETEMTALSAGETTVPVFNKVRFANVIEDQGLEQTDLDIIINSYGIQTTNVNDTVGNGNSDGKVAPADVWPVVHNATLVLCGIEGHYKGDGRGEHGDPATDCQSGHTYSCECTNWIVPEGGIYTTKSGTVYNAGEVLSCGMEPQTGDKFEYGDYVYQYNKYITQKIGSSTYWTSDYKLNTWSVLAEDTTKLEYGEILTNINGKNVGIMNYCFMDCVNMTTAPSIPSTITKMAGAFEGCSSLISVPEIPNTVEEMNNAFYSCTSLTNLDGVVIPDNVTSLEKVFMRCSALSDIDGLVIPDSVTDLGYTFAHCYSLTDASEFIIPKNATDIGYLFYYCKALVKAPLIPNKVTNMESAFSICQSLKTYKDSEDADGDFSNYIIPNSVTSMYSTFGGCDSIVISPAIPDSVKNMKYCFQGCDNLKTVTSISQNVTDMEHCFEKCILLENVPAIPSGVGYAAYLFADCTSLTGELEINGACSLSSSSVFYNVDFEAQSLTLTGSSTRLDTLGKTGKNYCEVCNGRHKKADEEHTCHGGTATCSQKAICIVCNNAYGELGEHSGGTATCSVQATCSLCGEKYGDYGNCTVENIVGSNCSKCGRSVTVIESQHNPYQYHRGLLGSWDYSDAESVTIVVTYQTDRGTSDYAYIKNSNGDYLDVSEGYFDEEEWVSSYKFAGTTLRTGTYNTSQGKSGSVYFNCDSSGNNYYGVQVIIIPNY